MLPSRTCITIPVMLRKAFTKMAQAASPNSVCISNPSTIYLLNYSQITSTSGSTSRTTSRLAASKQAEASAFAFNADITRLLQNLVRQEILVQDGQGRWTRYRLPSESDSLHFRLFKPLLHESFDLSLVGSAF